MSDTDNNKKDDTDSYAFLTKIEGYLCNIISVIKEFLKNRDAENKDLKNTIKDISDKTDETTTQINKIHTYIEDQLIEKDKELTKYKEKLEKQGKNHTEKLFFDISQLLRLIHCELELDENQENKILLERLGTVQNGLLGILSYHGIKKIELNKGDDFSEKTRLVNLPSIIIEHTETQDKSLDCTIKSIEEQGYYYIEDGRKKALKPPATINVYKFTKPDSSLEQTSIDEKNDATATENDDQNKKQGAAHE